MWQQDMNRWVGRQVSELPQLGGRGERDETAGIAHAGGNHFLVVAQRPMRAAEDARLHDGELLTADQRVRQAAGTTEIFQQLR